MNGVAVSSAIRHAAFAILCASALTACDASRPAELQPPQPGQLVLRLEASTKAEGAVRIRLEGPDIGQIAAAQEGAFALSRASGVQHDVVVLGTLISGPLLRFYVADTNRLGEYGASIVEVADVDNLLRNDLGEYSLEVLR